MGATIAPAAALILRGGVETFHGVSCGHKAKFTWGMGRGFYAGHGERFSARHGARFVLSLKVVVGVQNWFFEKPFRTSYWSLIETVAVLLSFENTEFLCTRFRP